MRAAPHPQERARLAALGRYAVLDTPREADFDAIAELAAALCEVPAAQINFIAADRQWSKAEVGVGVQTIPLEVSICSHTLLEPGLVEIPDLREDPRTADNPAVTGAPQVRFYAGIQLRGTAGDPIGTLCVLDMQPRTLNDTQRRSLTVLASQVMAQLDLRATLANEAVLRNEIDHRVKNSLQSIGAYVSLKRRASGSAEAVEVLGGVQQQIDTVAQLHEHVSSVSGEDQLDLAAYLGRVTELLDAIAPDPVSVSGHFEPAPMAPKAGAIVGTVLNELVANAVKHSLFAQGGTIAMTGERTGESAYRITVQDNGALPAPVSANASKRAGLGLAIIAASVRQLGGSITSAMTTDGYRTVLEFAV